MVADSDRLIFHIEALENEGDAAAPAHTSWNERHLGGLQLGRIVFVLFLYPTARQEPRIPVTPFCELLCQAGGGGCHGEEMDP